MVVEVPAEYRRADQAPDRGIARPAARGAGRDLPHRDLRFPGAVCGTAPARHRIPQPHFRTDPLPGECQSARLLSLVGHPGRHADRPGAGRHGPQPGGATTAPATFPGRGKSFFLHDLLRNVIFAESGWVSLDRNAVRRAAIFRYGAMAPIALASLAMLGAWGWSYTSNKSLISSAGRRRRGLPDRRQGRAQPQGDFRGRGDLRQRPRR